MDTESTLERTFQRTVNSDEYKLLWAICLVSNGLSSLLLIFLLTSLVKVFIGEGLIVEEDARKREEALATIIVLIVSISCKVTLGFSAIYKDSPFWFRGHFLFVNFELGMGALLLIASSVRHLIFLNFIFDLMTFYSADDLLFAVPLTHWQSELDIPLSIRSSDTISV